MDYTIFPSVIDVLYKISIIILGFVIVLGYLFYLGYRDQLGRYLENTRPLDLKIHNARNGYIIFNVLVMGAAYIILAFGEFSQLRRGISLLLTQTFGIEILKVITYMPLFIVLSIFVAIRLGKIESPKDYFFTRTFLKDAIIAFLLMFIFVLFVGIFESYVWVFALFSIYTSLFVIIPFSIFKWGSSQAESLEIEYKATVNLKDGKSLKNLFLYQTTGTDYRFEDEDRNEYIIPVSNIDKIIYEHEEEKE